MKTIEEAIEIAERFIKKRDIKDEDFKQDMYLIVIEKYKFSYHDIYGIIDYRYKKYLGAQIDSNNNLTDAQKYYCTCPYSDVYRRDLRNIIANNMRTGFSDKEIDILKYRFGFYGKPKTLEQIGEIYGVHSERVRQIEAKILRKLRNPSISKLLVEYINDDCAWIDNYIKN